MTLKLKIILLSALALVVALYQVGSYLYDCGYEDATEFWETESNKKLSQLKYQKEKERAELEAKLVSDFANDLRVRDERLREYEEYVRANRNQECSADERNAIARIAVGLEEVASKAIRFLEAERKN